MERDPRSLFEVEWSLWCTLLCECVRCGAYLELAEFDHLVDDSPIEWAQAAAPFVHSQGWSAPDEFELLCPRCTAVLGEKRIAARQNSGTAWIFSVSAECGDSKSAAEALARHFEGHTVKISTGQEFLCGVRVWQEQGAWWASASPEGVSRIGFFNESEAAKCTAVGFGLYDRLRTAPAYRYALVGVEVDGFRSYEELGPDVVILDFSGLVVADAVWQHLGSPSVFVPFSPGYRWRPFVIAR